MELAIWKCTPRTFSSSKITAIYVLENSRVDNQALSWLKTYSTDQSLGGRCIIALEEYHFRVEHRPRTQHRNADGLSERTNDYRWREQQLEKLPPVAERWNVVSQDGYE